MKKTGVIILLLVLFYEGFSSIGKKQVRLRLQDTTSNLLDETDIYLDLGVSPAFIAIEDAQKKFDTDTLIPQLYSLTSNNIPCFSNSYGSFTTSVAITLGDRVAGGSVYAISATLIDNFEPTSIIQLEDKGTGLFHDLRQGAYIINIPTPENTVNRFVLHISYPPVISSEPSGCNNDDGIIAVMQDSTITWSSCQLYDGNMNFISAYNNIKGNFNFGSLVEGNYNLAFVYGIYSSVSPIHIGGRQIIASISAPNVYVEVGDTVQFYSDARNATHFTWNFGDSTLIDGVANPEVIYSEPGTYQVELLCTNDEGCAAIAYITIYVAEATGITEQDRERISLFSRHKQLSVFITGPVTNPYRLAVFNITGQKTAEALIASANYTLDMSSYPTGVYVVQMQGAYGSFSKKIFIE